MSYHAFKCDDGTEYGSFEVFFAAKGSLNFNNDEGFYWWPCFPGCMPDGEAIGPFNTAEEAIADAREA